MRRIRLGRDETQEEVAYRAGLHVTYLSGIERGVRNPSLTSIRALAVGLDVSVSDLFAFDYEAPGAQEIPGALPCQDPHTIA